MTTTPLRPVLSRAAHKRRLLHIIAGATEQLLAIEVADYRASRLAATIVEPPTSELAGTTRVTRIRSWAREQGIPTATAGRIRKDVEAAYTAAHPEDTPP